MLFCQVWIDRRASRSNLAKPQTFPLEKPRGLNSGLRFSLVFWMILYKDYTGFYVFRQYGSSPIKNPRAVHEAKNAALDFSDINNIDIASVAIKLYSPSSY